MIHVLALARSGRYFSAPRQIARNASCTASSASASSRSTRSARPYAGASVAVVELGQRDLVRSRDERDDGFVREVCQVATRHGPAPYRAPRGPYQRRDRAHVDLDSPAAAGRFDRIRSMSYVTRAQLLAAAGSLVLSADSDLAKVAATAELLAIDFYKRSARLEALQGRRARVPRRGPRQRDRRTTTCSRTALGKATPSGLRFKYPNGVFTSRTSVATLGQALETAFLGTYLGARRVVQEQRTEEPRRPDRRDRVAPSRGVHDEHRRRSDRPGAGLRRASIHGRAGACRAQAVPGLTTKVAMHPELPVVRDAAPEQVAAREELDAQVVVVARLDTSGRCRPSSCRSSARACRAGPGRSSRTRSPPGPDFTLRLESAYQNSFAVTCTRVGNVLDVLAPAGAGASTTTAANAAAAAILT